jgi:hypothetical protein
MEWPGPRTEVTWASGVNIVAGAWLLGAPLVLGYASRADAAWNDLVVGLVVLGVAGIRIFRPIRSAWWSVVNMVAAVWLMLSPFLLGHTDLRTAMWNDLALGAVVLIEATISFTYGRRASSSPR